MLLSPKLIPELGISSASNYLGMGICLLQAGQVVIQNFIPCLLSHGHHRYVGSGLFQPGPGSPWGQCLETGGHPAKSLGPTSPYPSLPWDVIPQLCRKLRLWEERDQLLHSLSQSSSGPKGAERPQHPPLPTLRVSQTLWNSPIALEELLEWLAGGMGGVSGGEQGMRRGMRRTQLAALFHRP